jgi:D-alanyl-lipoteichoic acid acyltransferase DltB (MBOAT superfamily)
MLESLWWLTFGIIFIVWGLRQAVLIRRERFIQLMRDTCSHKDTTNNHGIVSCNCCGIQLYDLPDNTFWN